MKDKNCPITYIFSKASHAPFQFISKPPRIRIAPAVSKATKSKASVRIVFCDKKKGRFSEFFIIDPKQYKHQIISYKLPKKCSNQKNYYFLCVFLK